MSNAPSTGTKNRSPIYSVSVPRSIATNSPRMGIIHRQGVNDMAWLQAMKACWDWAWLLRLSKWPKCACSHKVCLRGTFVAKPHVQCFFALWMTLLLFFASSPVFLFFLEHRDPLLTPMTAFCLYVSRHSSAGRSSVASETKEAFPFPHFQRRNWMGLDGTLEGKKIISPLYCYWFYHNRSIQEELTVKVAGLSFRPELLHRHASLTSQVCRSPFFFAFCLHSFYEVFKNFLCYDPYSFDHH